MPEMPLVSVVIPCRNEKDWIERCLTAVLRQDYPGDRMEILVVDGMSDDGTYEFLVDLAKRETRLRVLRNPREIVPSSLNLAIAAARGELIVRVDAHTIIAEDYVSVGAETLGRTGAQNVGGPMVKLGGGAVGDAIATAMSSRFGIGAYFHFAQAEREADTVYLGMWPRSVFEEIGLFDEELVRNQDDELNYRLRKHGGRIVCTPRMRSQYQNRQSWKKLIKQFFQYGLWKVRVLQKHPAQMSVRHFVPPLFDLAIVFGLLAAPWLRPAGYAALGAIGAYAIVIAVVAAGHTKGCAARMRLGLAFACIHHAWGLGFLAGMVRFAPQWFRPEAPAKKLTGDSLGAPAAS